MNPKLSSLLKAYKMADAKDAMVPEGETIVVNELVRKAASVYELIRNTLEYSEAHLLRRNAIRRILRRRLESDMDGERVAEELLHELIWARYLPNKEVPIIRKSEVAVVLEKYVPLFTSAERSEDSARMTRWLLDLVSTELEYLLVPPRREEALVSFAYSSLKERIEVPAVFNASAEDQDLQLFIGVHRTLLRSNLATLRYRIFSLFYPSWSHASDATINEITAHLATVEEAVERQLFHPIGEAMTRVLRPQMVLFKVLHDVVMEEPVALDHPASLTGAIEKAARRRYSAFRQRLGRLVIRAVVFLFFTKMVLAFIIELPYEVLVLRQSNYLSLMANVIVHPVVLAVLGLSGTIPEKKNTELLVAGITDIVSGTSSEEIKLRQKSRWGSGTVGFVFRLLYAITFLVSYGAIIALLVALHFNVVSIVLFLLFLSLVMFLGITIRRSRRELVIVPPKAGVFSAIGDFFTLPIIRAGRWISIRTPRINVFLFFLDYIVEAPFKLVIAVIEGWLAFMKEKKEDLDVQG